MSDLVSALVREVYDALMIDADFATWQADGFAWFPHRLQQRIHAEDGRLTVETNLLESASPLEPEAERILVDLMRHPPLSGFTLEGGVVRLHSSVPVPEEAKLHGLRLFTLAALLQATYAELGVASLAQRTGLAAAASGARPEPDGMLRFVGMRVVPAGDAPSAWAGELHETAEALQAADVRVTPAAGGVNARMPFRGDRTLLQIRCDEPHPELGNGVFLRLFLPSGSTPWPGSREALALHLNSLEANAPGPFATIGSWTLERSEPEIELPVLPGPPRLAHVVFAPNLLYKDVRLAELALEVAARAHWAEHLFP